MSAAIRATDITVRFGGLTALDGVTFDAAPGEIVGIIGPNGAGKSTLFDALCGLTRLERGHVELGDRDITALTPHDRAKLGLGRSFQDGRLFPSLTVAEALSIAVVRHLPVEAPLSILLGGPFARRRRRDVDTRVAEVITLMGLDPYAEAYIRELSTGTRRLVDLACAVAQAPDVLLLDEPSSGVAAAEVPEMARLIEDVRATTGCTILLIEHDIPLVSRLADRLLALETGRIIRIGDPQEVLADELVVAAYLGQQHAPLAEGMAS